MFFRLLIFVTYLSCGVKVNPGPIYLFTSLDSQKFTSPRRNVHLDRNKIIPSCRSDDTSVTSPPWNHRDTPVKAKFMLMGFGTQIPRYTKGEQAHPSSLVLLARDEGHPQ
ncbi:hypothetical protein Tco_1045961 [Tanacetum coccineum]